MNGMKKQRFVLVSLWLVSCAIVFLIGGKLSQTSGQDVSSPRENDLRPQTRDGSASVPPRGSSGFDSSAGRKLQRRTDRGSVSAARNLGETIDSIMDNDNALSRSKLLLSFIAQLTADDYPQVVKALVEKDFDGKLPNDYFMVIRSWTKVDPSAAMEFATNERKKKFDRVAVLRCWASYDVEGVTQWLEANVPATSRRWDMEEVNTVARNLLLEGGP